MTELTIPLEPHQYDTAEKLVQTLEQTDVTVEHNITDDQLILHFTGSGADGFYYDGIPSLDLNIPYTNDAEREVIQKAEQLFSDIGVSFDTGTSFVGDDRPKRCWLMDWSLDGACVSLPQKQ